MMGTEIQTGDSPHVDPTTVVVEVMGAAILEAMVYLVGMAVVIQVGMVDMEEMVVETLAHTCPEWGHSQGVTVQWNRYIQCII